MLSKIMCCQNVHFFGGGREGSGDIVHNDQHPSKAVLMFVLCVCCNGCAFVPQKVGMASILCVLFVSDHAFMVCEHLLTLVLLFLTNVNCFTLITPNFDIVA